MPASRCKRSDLPRGLLTVVEWAGFPESKFQAVNVASPGQPHTLPPWPYPLHDSPAVRSLPISQRSVHSDHLRPPHDPSDYHQETRTQPPQIRNAERSGNSVPRKLAIQAKSRHRDASTGLTNAPIPSIRASTVSPGTITAAPGVPVVSTAVAPTVVPAVINSTKSAKL